MRKTFKILDPVPHGFTWDDKVGQTHDFYTRYLVDCIGMMLQVLRPNDEADLCVNDMLGDEYRSGMIKDYDVSQTKFGLLVWVMFLDGKRFHLVIQEHSNEHIQWKEVGF